MTRRMGIKGVIFDLDGTVVENSYDWPKIRRELGNSEVSILHYICGLEEPERSRKWAVLERHEAEQTERAVLRDGIRVLPYSGRAARLRARVRHLMICKYWAGKGLQVCEC